MSSQKPITKPQLEILSRTRELQDRHGACGLFPRSPGQYKTVRALEEMGLLMFAGRGADIDGEFESEVPIWEITEPGRAELKRHDGTECCEVRK